MNHLRLAVAAILSAVVTLPLQVAAWNAPTHMVTGAIAYRILESESPRTVSVIKTLLEKHPWYSDRWRDDVEKLPESQRGEMLFMLAARWAVYRFFGAGARRALKKLDEWNALEGKFGQDKSQELVSKALAIVDSFADERRDDQAAVFDRLVKKFASFTRGTHLPDFERLHQPY